jgi:hypothetical protein
MVSNPTACTTGEQGDRTRNTTSHKYKPVRYTEYYQENKVILSFNYRFVSVGDRVKCW